MQSKSLCLAIGLASVSLFAGCASWDHMDKADKGTAVGGTGGAVVGAVAGGPIGAVVGAGVGAYAGHEAAAPGSTLADNNGGGNARNAAYNTGLVRSAQQALNARGYAVGDVDGQWGPATESALRHFQQASGLPQTGELDARTVSALGIS